MNINWYPGHMAKTKRLIKENIDLIDVVYEIIDARIPYSSKIKDIDDVINDKPRILIMTKIDLCDLNETNKWVSYYENIGYKVLKLNLLSDKNINIIVDATKDMMKDYDEIRMKKGLNKRRYRALIIGIPNVGKSTLINRLVGKKVTKVGNMPGITKELSWIRLSDEVELLDSPGILWPKLDNEEVALNLASTSAIKEEILPIDDVAVHILNKLNKHYKAELLNRYGIDNVSDDIVETFDIIGRKRGCLIKGGEVDYDKVSMLIIKDLKEGNIKNITLDRFDEVNK
jgi:ribosome biogenesis GTPase A